MFHARYIRAHQTLRVHIVEARRPEGAATGSVLLLGRCHGDFAEVAPRGDTTVTTALSMVRERGIREYLAARSWEPSRGC